MKALTEDQITRLRATPEGRLQILRAQLARFHDDRRKAGEGASQILDQIKQLRRIHRGL